MFLSIIIPIFNCSKTIKRCIDRIIPVLDKSTELILVDDGSGDGSDIICRNYSAQFPNIRFVRQENSGPSAARNRGISLAQGMYITFIDGDDYIDTDLFLSFYQWIKTMPYDAQVWASDFIRVTHDGKAIDYVFQISQTSSPQVKQVKEICCFLNAPGPYWNVWRYFFRLDFLVEHNVQFPEGYHCGEDMAFMTKVFSHVDKISFFHQPYYRYVVENPDSLSRQVSLDRVHSFLTMFDLSMQYAKESSNSKISMCLVNKLLVEYVMNLSLPSEISKDEKKMAEKYFASEENALKLGDKFVFFVLHALISVFGIGCISNIFFFLKKQKRKIKQKRLKLASNKMG